MARGFNMFSILKFKLLTLVAVVVLFFGTSINADEKDSFVSTDVDQLLVNLGSAKTQQEGREAEDAVWRYWFDQAPTPAARKLLDAAIDRREAYDYEAAENILNELVEEAPDYAEGYNQRAFIRYLRDNFSASQQDLYRTLSLEPKHFGAHAGLYQVFSRTGMTDKAFEALKMAVVIHPWLRERGGLPKSMWPESYRNIHEGRSI